MSVLGLAALGYLVRCAVAGPMSTLMHIVLGSSRDIHPLITYNMRPGNQELLASKLFKHAV